MGLTDKPVPLGPFLLQFVAQNPDRLLQLADFPVGVGNGAGDRVLGIRAGILHFLAECHGNGPQLARLGTGIGYRPLHSACCGRCGCFKLASQRRGMILQITYFQQPGVGFFRSIGQGRGALDGEERAVG